MKVVWMYEREAVHEFVREAAAHFAAHPSHWTYTGGEVEPGCLFGVRWGAGDSVLVFRLNDALEPLVFADEIACATGRPVRVAEERTTP